MIRFSRQQHSGDMQLTVSATYGQQKASSTHTVPRGKGQLPGVTAAPVTMPFVQGQTVGISLPVSNTGNDDRVDYDYRFKSSDGFEMSGGGGSSASADYPYTDSYTPETAGELTLIITMHIADSTVTVTRQLIFT